MTSRGSLRMYFGTQRPDGAWEAGRQIYPTMETPRTWDEMRPKSKRERQRIVPDIVLMSIVDYADGPRPSIPGERTADYWQEVPLSTNDVARTKPLCIDKIPENLDDLQARYRDLGIHLARHFRTTNLTIFVR